MRILRFRHAKTARSLPGAAIARGEEAMNFFSRWIARNPLKRLDSDERIQGNPRKSNGGYLVF
jgi:hypothetical protein